MRRPIIATIVLLLAAIPVLAQHGGSHAAGGHFSSGHPGFSGGHAGGFASHGFSGPRMSSSPRFSSGIRSGPARGFTRVPSSRANFSRGPAFRNRFRSPIIRNRGFGFSRNCSGFPCRRFYSYPWAYAGFYDPYWWWDQSSYDDDYERDRAVASEMNQQSLEEMRMRRQQEAEAAGDQDVNQDVYARRAPRPVSDDPQSTPIIPATVLIFRDQRRQEVHNYAIVGQTLWSFAPQHTQRIPLADLDLTATARANEDQGVTFRVPAAPEAQ
jgi:hypothetical protein